MNAKTLTVSDISVSVNQQPRINHVRLAEALGYSAPFKLAQLIDRHWSALERFGEVYATVAQTSEKGGRPGRVLWLTKKQALYVTTKAETPNATEVTIQMVEVFDAFTSHSKQPPCAPKVTTVRAHERRLSPAPRSLAREVRLYVMDDGPDRDNHVVLILAGGGGVKLMVDISPEGVAACKAGDLIAGTVFGSSGVVIARLTANEGGMANIEVWPAAPARKEPGRWQTPLVSILGRVVEFDFG